VLEKSEGKSSWRGKLPSSIFRFAFFVPRFGDAFVGVAHITVSLGDAGSAEKKVYWGLVVVV
jgi:hypothetical protein